MRLVAQLWSPVIAHLTKPARSDARLEPRTSLFAMATLYAGVGSSPIKVRDLSTRGALIEGAVIPSPGTSVRLCRGSLSITGKIVWCDSGRAGLRFESSLSVAEWLPGGQLTTAQQRVDEVFQEVKARGTGSSLSSNLHPTLKPAKLTAGELTDLKLAIQSLADDLAADAGVVQRHLSKLQILDLVAQALTKLAAER